LKLVGEIARSLGAHVLVDEVYLEANFDSPWKSAFHLGSNFIATSVLSRLTSSGNVISHNRAVRIHARRVWPPALIAHTVKKLAA